MNNIDKKLYELFSDKTLSEGCYIQESKRLLRLVYETWIKNAPYFCVDLTEMQWSPQCWFNPKDYEKAIILWHEPHLEDLLKRIKDWDSLFEVKPNSIWLSLWSDEREEEFWKQIPYNPILSLMNQEESTKQAIVELFSN